MAGSVTYFFSKTVQLKILGTEKLGLIEDLQSKTVVLSCETFMIYGMLYEVCLFSMSLNPDR